MEERTDSTDSSLLKLLQAADLTKYESSLINTLKLRNAGDLQYTEEQDLLGIGMSRPEQKRLRKEYEKMFPSGFVGKLKRVFGRSDNNERKDSQATNAEDEDQHVIPLEKIVLCKELGSGEFGAVWQATWKGGPNGTETVQVAVKCVAPDKMIASSSAFLQEASIMTRMRHDNVVRLYGVVLDTKRVMMVSELATCGSLLECLHKPCIRDSFPVQTLCDYAEQIAKGMAYLESQRLIHRDLAARNVLVFSPKKVKISDFGLSRSLGVGEDYYRSEFSPSLKLPIAWCAPECINFLKFTSSSDVWAYGVTLWELFTYGQMPWNGMSGADILRAVDRERRLLPRPYCCPEDIYETMKECWTHSPSERPTFAQIVTVLPERLPQRVKAINDCHDGKEDHLQFNKNDIITVIHKTPPEYPDGYFWLGSLQNGRCGLFKPTDSVAYLGAECPNSIKVLSTSCVNGTVDKKEVKEKKNTKKSKEEERKKLKDLISEPIGDVRHTCHVGIDGSAFGLLQFDKKEIPAPTSPSLSHVSHSPVTMRSDSIRDGISSKTTHSMRDIGSIRLSSPNNTSLRARAPSQPPDAFQHYLQQKEPSAPPLTASAANSMNKDMQTVFEELNSSLRYFESSSTAPLLPEDEFSMRPGRHTSPKPVAAIYARTPTNGQKNAVNNDALINEVSSLERDLTNYSLSTINDYSDTRPLISSPTSSIHKQKSPTSPKNVISEVRPMTEEESERWKEKQEREHRKAESQLTDVRRKENAQFNQYLSSNTNTKTGSDSQSIEWSPEAQEAYKLLVECGTTLKRTPSPSSSPLPYRDGTLDRKERFSQPSKSPIPPPRPATPPMTEEDENLITSYSPQKRIHIIETKLLDGPSKSPPGLPPKGETRQPPGLPPKMRQIPVTLNGRSANYDNLNGVGAGRCPPPVPPKPKVRIRSPSPPPSIRKRSPTAEGDSPGFASSIARSTLFTANKKEEVVKF